MYSKYKKAFWLGLIIPAIQQFTGVSAITFYAPVLFAKQPNSGYLPSVVAIIQIVFAMLTPVVEGLGRRTLLLLGALICSIGHLMCIVSLDPTGLSTIRNWVFNFGVFVFIASFNVTFGPITYVCMKL